MNKRLTLYMKTDVIQLFYECQKIMGVLYWWFFLNQLTYNKGSMSNVQVNTEDSKIKLMQVNFFVQLVQEPKHDETQMKGLKSFVSKKKGMKSYHPATSES